MADSLGLRARWVLTREGGAPILRRDATVVVSQGRIGAVLAASGPGIPAHVFDLGNSLLMPGFINTHCHCVSGPLFRGVLEDQSFPEGEGSVIDRIMLPLGEIMTEISGEDEIRAVAALGQLETLKAGSTTIVDQPRAAHDPFALAARDIGLRAWIHPYLMSGPEASWAWENDGSADTDVARTLRTFHRWRERFDEGENGRIRIGLGPHATDTCSPGLIRAIARTRDQLGVRVTAHLSQGIPEVELARKRFGISPVEYLDRLGLLDPSLIAAHCVYAEPSDLELMAARGVTIAHCPLSYARSGRLAARSRFVGAGVRTTLGTDAHALDIVADLRMAAINSKYDTGSTLAGSAWELVEAATVAAADALARPDLGRIVPGARADLIAIGLERPHLEPVHDPVKTLVWNGTGRDVDMVMVDGEFLVRDGRYTRRSEGEIVAAGAAAMQRVWRVAEARGIIAGVGRASGARPHPDAGGTSRG